MLVLGYQGSGAIWRHLQSSVDWALAELQPLAARKEVANKQTLSIVLWFQLQQKSLWLQ